MRSRKPDAEKLRDAVFRAAKELVECSSAQGIFCHDCYDDLVQAAKAHAVATQKKERKP